MATWRPQHYQQVGVERGVSDRILENAIAVAANTKSVNPALPPIFSLRHIAHIVNVEYGFLRAVVSRVNTDPYSVFRLRKSSGHLARGFRVICVPDPDLMRVQRWISKKILAEAHPHSSSFAYAPGSNILDAAKQHCGCRWMIKLDIRRFFESISEISAYNIFKNLGYQPLVSFELARLCTRLGSATYHRRRHRWRVHNGQYSAITCYLHQRIGHLPQGAPTSPMLANLCMQAFDENVTKIAADHDLIYSRYADDLCLSAKTKSFSRKMSQQVIGAIYQEMSRHGLSPNVTKTRIAPPGARKSVLGLLVDGEDPRLSREFRARLRQHLYYVGHKEVGPAKHAANRGFASVIGLRHHIEGLVAFADNIDSDFASRCRQSMEQVNWPL